MKFFGLWDVEGIKVEDPGLKSYINLNPVFVPKTGGRNSNQKFYKSKYTIVERLINKLMVPGHKGKKHKVTSYKHTGKGLTVYKIVLKTLKIIEEKTKQNPIKILVKAVENAAPREEITTIEYGGARYPQSVECAPQRRIDIVLRMFTQGAYQKAFNKKAKIENYLADEILKAYESKQDSVAISKKLELERQADASR